jgi:SAM-dependent methyltransferase
MPSPGSGSGRRGIRRRHLHLQSVFGPTGIQGERRRYVRSLSMRYRLDLIERFVDRHLVARTERCLEVGPGAGRFSPRLGAGTDELVVLDLSRSMLKETRRRLRREGRRGRNCEFVQGSLEDLPFRDRAFDSVVALGVLVFVAQDLDTVLRRVAMLLRPGGLLLAELRTPTGDLMALFPSAPRSARRILQAPREHHLWSILRKGYQPLDPEHLAGFEAGWVRPHELQARLRRVGLRLADRMTVGPNFASHPELLAALRRDRRAYANALKVEEETGRWPELLGAGAGLLFAAERRR